MLYLHSIFYFENTAINIPVITCAGQAINKHLGELCTQVVRTVWQQRLGKVTFWDSLHVCFQVF